MPLILLLPLPLLFQPCHGHTISHWIRVKRWVLTETLSFLVLRDLPSANLPAGLGEEEEEDVGRERTQEGHKTRSLCLRVDLLIAEDGRGGEINRLKTVSSKMSLRSSAWELEDL